LRALSLLFVLGISQVGVAQTSTWTTLDQTIQDMFQRVREKAYDPSTNITGLAFRFSGVVRTGSIVTDTKYAVAYYRYLPTTSPYGKADLKFNLLNFHYDAAGNVRTDSEIVEDGKTVWHYIPPDKTYSVAAYDITAPTSQTASTYISDALSAADLYTPGMGGPSYATRLLRELFVNYSANGSPVNFYHPWVITPGGPTSGPGPYRDPLTRLFRNASTGLEQTTRPAADPNVYYIVYQNSYAGVLTKVMAFEIYVDPNLADGDPDKQTIRRIYMTESSPLNMLQPTNLRRKTSYTSWTIELGPTTDFSYARFTPVTTAEAPDIASWKPLLGPGAVKN